jgi:hypothetical protein
VRNANGQIPLVNEILMFTSVMEKWRIQMVIDCFDREILYILNSPDLAHRSISF